ncbi:MAG: hypothetical protein KDC53_02535, partial [Saprospiraceae bacterium]|nr:hypothetical protein [Saprospiraceae bacterium]
MKKLYLLTVLAISTVCLFGQAADEPKDLNSNVMVAKDWSTVTTIENTFNAARRQEETQLGLGANAIQNLNLPDQTTWDGYSIDQKALYIMNDERTSRAGVNYGMGGVKGLPFNGIEANLDQVSQDWAQYNVDNNVFEHCHPDNMPANCPEGRIAGAYPNGCTEFGGGIENLYANSDGTVSPTIVTYDAIFGWIYVDATSNWGHRHAMLAQSYDDDYGDVGQEGFVGFGIAQTTNAAVTWKTIATVNFVNPVSDAEAVNCGYNITVSTNSLVPCNNPPVINSVSKVDPNDCNNQIGSITINATGGTLEYSVNGNTWQMSNTFTNLAPGSYSVLVRFANDPLCRASYNQNPVIISPAKGTEYALTNLNLGIPDDNPTGVESIINVPASGQITNVRITNLNVTHAWVADLNFSLISPM